MTKDLLLSLLAKYERGVCNPEELAILHRFFDSFQTVEEIWENYDLSEREKVRIEIFNRLDRRVIEYEKNGKKRKEYIISGVAASILILISISFLIRQIDGHTFNGVALSHQVIVKTSSSQLITYTLPDRSKIHLAPNTMVSYDSLNFSTNRSLELEGQAFFEIAKNEHYPFQVMNEQAIVTVLGTKFNINTHGADTSMIVSVAEGVVRISNEFDVDTLKRDQQLKVKAGEFVRTQLSPFYLGWHQRRLVFDGNSLIEVADMLGELYKVNIEIAVENTEKYATAAEFPLTSAEDAIKNLCFIHVLDYEAKEDGFIIKSVNKIK